MQGSSNGLTVYSEVHNLQSNENGLISLQIGNGNVVSGTFASIDWANGPYFIQTETDPMGGANYSILSTTQLLSVPYALHAKTADNISDADSTNEIQTFSVSTIGDTLYLSRGNHVIIPGISAANFQIDPNNPPLIEIKEVMFNPEGTDSQYEWVKIYNPNNFAVDLSDYRIASAGLQFEEIAQLSGTIPAQTCWIVGGPESGVINGSPTFNIAVAFSASIQNSGSTADGVAIYYGSLSESGNYPLDVVIYGGTNSNDLPGPDGNPAGVDIADGELEGQSIIKINGSWQFNVDMASPDSCD